MRPLIGISTRHLKDSEKNREGHGVGYSYIESVAAAGGAPVLIPLLQDEGALRAVYEQVQGVLFPGGEDVHPRFYNQEPHAKLGDVDEIRDEVELRLCRWAFEENKPVLGLCRGIQLMNVALGGTLIQDIPSQRGDGDLGHSQESGTWEHSSHGLRINSTSKIAQVVGATELEVNSFHHQAIERVAEPLTVVGAADDGLAEAVEAKGRNFFIGLQCHPEHLWQGPDEAWLRLFKGFVEAARSYPARG